MRSAELEPALVGRDVALARLRDRLVDAAMFDRGSAVLVAGERGMGKTRLVDQVAREAGVWGVAFLRGAGAPARPDLPCGLFVEVLRAYYLKYWGRRERGTLREIVAGLAPQLWEPLFPLRRRPPSSSEGATSPQLRQALFLARLGQLLLESGRQRPAVLCLEDLHWADRASLQLLCQLAHQSASSSLLIVGTYRPEVRDAANDINLEQVVWEFCRYPHFERLRLERLSLVQTRVVLYSCFAPSAFGEDLVEWLHRQSGGVPLFIAQHLEHLRREGILYQDRGVWVNRPLAGVEGPVSMRAALQEQLRGLSPAQRAILGCAALQGECFAGEPLARAMGWPLIELLRELGRLERATHLVRRCERGFCFAHPQFAAIFCELLPEAQRRPFQPPLAPSEEARP